MNPWIVFVSDYRKKHPNLSYKEALKRASLRYRQKGGAKTATHTMPDGTVMPGKMHEKNK